MPLWLRYIFMVLVFEKHLDIFHKGITNQFPDATGLIGQYAQGNEPSFHIPYFYNYAGAPWKTQRLQFFGG